MLLIPFYRLNIVYHYNNNTGSVNIVDQLSNVYMYYSQGHINSKWWCDIWCWGYQLLLKKYYICYITFHGMINRKKVLSYYNFINQIALAWIEHDLYWPEKNSNQRKSMLTFQGGVRLEERGKKVPAAVKSQESPVSMLQVQVQRKNFQSITKNCILLPENLDVT